MYWFHPWLTHHRKTVSLNLKKTNIYYKLYIIVLRDTEEWVTKESNCLESCEVSEHSINQDRQESVTMSEAACSDDFTVVVVSLYQ